MIRETETLIAAVKKMYPVALFFKNRYFPDGQAFYSEKALVEMKKGGRTIAPFAIPAAGGIALEKQGYRTEYLEGPYIAPKMLITAGDLAKKAFGESQNPEDHQNSERKNLNRMFWMNCAWQFSAGRKKCVWISLRTAKC